MHMFLDLKLAPYPLYHAVVTTTSVLLAVLPARLSSGVMLDVGAVCLYRSQGSSGVV